jgi:phage FluMu protein Com
MKDIRCPYCDKLLGKFDGSGEIKCNRCKHIVRFDTKNNKSVSKS